MLFQFKIFTLKKIVRIYLFILYFKNGRATGPVREPGLGNFYFFTFPYRKLKNDSQRKFKTVLYLLYYVLLYYIINYYVTLYCSMLYVEDKMIFQEYISNKITFQN